MNCPKCGNEISKNLETCIWCGTKLSSTRKTQEHVQEKVRVHCKMCGVVTEENTQYPVEICPFCGSKELDREGAFEQSYQDFYKEPKKTRSRSRKARRVAPFIILIVLCFSITTMFSIMRLATNIVFDFTNVEEIEVFEWGDDIILGDVLPQPMGNEAEILSNTNEWLCMYLQNATEKDYKEYVKACEKAGFTIDVEQYGTWYEAYNKEGYQLCLWYDESEEECCIDLRCPIEMGEFRWPSSKIANMLPVPTSNIGKIEMDASYGICIYVGKITITEFDAYIDACIKNGFVVDYERYEDLFIANHEDGYSLYMEYCGNETMYIQVKEADE